MASVEVGKLHGEFCTDTYFGGVAWCERTGVLVYQAETIFKPADPLAEAAFEYRQSWGSKLAGCYSPGLFMLSLATGAVRCIKLPGGLYASSVSLGPSHHGSVSSLSSW